MEILLQFHESENQESLKSMVYSTLCGAFGANLVYKLDYFNPSMSLLVNDDNIFYYKSNHIDLMTISGHWFIGGYCYPYVRCDIYNNTNDTLIDSIISDKLTDDKNKSNIQNIKIFDTNISNAIGSLFDSFIGNINDIIL